MVDLSESRWNGVHGLPKYTGFISGMENFDAEFFGYSEKIANSMDPQSRMILEHAYEAILDAGM
jgi:fatty acid synthase